MQPPKTLIVYYSRTGTTAIVARAIAAAIGADVEPLVDTVVRRGFVGFLRSLVDTIFRRRATLRPLRHDPAAYDLVIVGTPVWADAVSAPVRAFFDGVRGRLPAVAFFLTDGKSGHDAVFREMAALAGRAPVAQLGLAREDVRREQYMGRVGVFVRSLPALAQRTTNRPPPVLTPWQEAGRPRTDRVALGR